MNNNGHRGFTLIELLVTLAVVAVLLSLAAPSFRALVTSSSLTSQANEFLAALAYTRSEAIKRNVRVTMCKSSSGTECVTTGGWQQGWIIFKDGTDGVVGVVDASDAIVRVRGPLNGGNTLVGQAAVANLISYLPNGMAAQSGRWDLCGSDQTLTGRDITLSSGSGYPAVTKDEPPVVCDGS